MSSGYFSLLHQQNYEGRYRKHTSAFVVSRSSVSILIRKVSKIIAEHLVPELIKLPKTVTQVEALTENFLKAHGFPQCLGAIDGTHIRISKWDTIFKCYFFIVVIWVYSWWWYCCNCCSSFKKYIWILIMTIMHPYNPYNHDFSIEASNLT